MNILCYFFIFIFEQFIAFYYFSNKFELKININSIVFFNVISFAVQFFIHFSGIAELNLVSFLICNVIVAIFCYDITFKQTIFNVILLEGIMITTELVVMYGISALFKTELSAFRENNTVILLETIGTKLLYFIVAFLLSKISKRDKNKDEKDFSLALVVLPIVSVFTVVSFVYFSLNYNVMNTVNVLFMLTSFILMASNIIVFLAHRKIVDTIHQNMEMLLEKQRAKINTEYYNNLESQYEASRILVHDIKRHLSVIRDYAEKNDSKSIINYVDSVYDDCKISSIKMFSNNKLFNVIINRYAQMCDEAGIAFDVDIRNVDFSSIQDSDLTSIGGNLLENAYDAASKSEKKRLNFLLISKMKKISASKPLTPQICRQTL